jgi:hypothetical protein
VRNRIGEKRAAKEISDTVQPFHGEYSLSVQKFMAHARTIIHRQPFG